MSASFYISGCHGRQQMEREDGGSVSQLATPCKYPDVSCGTTEMDQDGSVLMKAVLWRSTRRLSLWSLISTLELETGYLEL